MPTFSFRHPQGTLQFSGVFLLAPTPYMEELAIKCAEANRVPTREKLQPLAGQGLAIALISEAGALWQLSLYDYGFRNDYCEGCRYYNQSGALLCAVHPLGWVEIERCPDFEAQ